MKLNKSPLAADRLFILVAGYGPAVTFDTSLLAGESRDSDLSRFYLNNDMPAGRQEIDVYVNHDWKGATRCCLARSATIFKLTTVMRSAWASI